MSTSPQLETPRLILRQWRDEDRAPFAAMNSDAEVMLFFAAPLTRAESDEAVDRYNAQLARDGFTMFAAELKENGSFAGVIGIQVMRDVVPGLAQPAVEIGWRLAASAQGCGLATEGARAVVEYAFDEVGLREMVAITAPENAASRRVMEKLGMRQREELTFEHPRVPVGHRYRTHVVYRLKPDEYQYRDSGFARMTTLQARGGYGG